MQIKSIMRYHLAPIRITNIKKSTENKRGRGPSLVAQWERICLCMQDTWVQSLVQEDPTCLRATKPVSQVYWVWALGPGSCKYWPHVSQLLKPAHLEPGLLKRNIRNEKPTHYNERAAPLLSATEESLCSNEDPVQPKLNEQIHKI